MFFRNSGIAMAALCWGLFAVAKPQETPPDLTEYQQRVTAFYSATGAEISCDQYMLARPLAHKLCLRVIDGLEVFEEQVGVGKWGFLKINIGMFEDKPQCLSRPCDDAYDPNALSIDIPYTISSSDPELGPVQKAQVAANSLQKYLEKYPKKSSAKYIAIKTNGELIQQIKEEMGVRVTCMGITKIGPLNCQKGLVNILKLKSKAEMFKQVESKQTGKLMEAYVIGPEQGFFEKSVGYQEQSPGILIIPYVDSVKTIKRNLSRSGFNYRVVR